MTPNKRAKQRARSVAAQRHLRAEFFETWKPRSEWEDLTYDWLLDWRKQARNTFASFVARRATSIAQRKRAKVWSDCWIFWALIGGKPRWLEIELHGEGGTRVRVRTISETQARRIWTYSAVEFPSVEDMRRTAEKRPEHEIQMPERKEGA
jgi:hypothetical protein